MTPRQRSPSRRAARGVMQVRHASRRRRVFRDACSIAEASRAHSSCETLGGAQLLVERNGYGIIRHAQPAWRLCGRRPSHNLFPMMPYNLMEAMWLIFAGRVTYVTHPRLHSPLAPAAANGVVDVF